MKIQYMPDNVDDKEMIQYVSLFWLEYVVNR